MPVPALLFMLTTSRWSWTKSGDQQTTKQLCLSARHCPGLASSVAKHDNGDNQRQLLPLPLALLPCLSPAASFNTPKTLTSLHTTARLGHDIYDPPAHSEAARKRSNPGLLAMLPSWLSLPASPARLFTQGRVPKGKIAMHVLFCPPLN